MNKIIHHFKLWNKWRKNCLNGWFHKIMVLLGLRYSPTFDQFQSIEKTMLAYPDLTIKYREDRPDEN